VLSLGCETRDEGSASGPESSRRSASLSTGSKLLVDARPISDLLGSEEVCSCSSLDAAVMGADDSFSCGAYPVFRE